MAEDKIPNTERGEVAITLDRKHYVMRPSYQALVQIEHQTGHGLLKLWERLRSSEIGLREAAVIVTEGLRAGGEPAAIDKVGPMIYRTGLPHIGAPLMEFLVNALLGGRTPGEAEAAETDRTAPT